MSIARRGGKRPYQSFALGPSLLFVLGVDVAPAAAEAKLDMSGLDILDTLDARRGRTWDFSRASGGWRERLTVSLRRVLQSLDDGQILRQMCGRCLMCGR